MANGSSSNPGSRASARREADAYLDHLDSQIDGSDRGGVSDDSFSTLSPEARMLVMQVFAGSAHPGDPVKRIVTEVSQLMGMMDGTPAGTVGSVVADISGMSPEGRAHAFYILTAHPEYRVKGSRWHPAPYQLSEYTSTTNPNGYTTYQLMVDNIRGVADAEWASAVSIVEDSKRRAGDGDWQGAATTIRTAITSLEQRAKAFPAAYEPELAVALIHQEAFLGQLGDTDGAKTSIERAMRILAGLADSDQRWEPDLAKSLESYAYAHTDRQNWAGAITAIDGAIEIYEKLARRDPHEHDFELAGALSQKSEMQFKAGDPRGALGTIRQASKIIERVASEGRLSNAPVHEWTQSTIRERLQRFTIANREQQGNATVRSTAGANGQGPQAAVG